MPSLKFTPDPGKHKTLSSKDLLKNRRKVWTTVPKDITNAFQKTVCQKYNSFDKDEWDVHQSVMTGWEIKHVTHSGHMVVVTDDCRSAWVKEGEDPHIIVAGLEKSNPVPRKLIEWLLLDYDRYGKNKWDITPINDDGWVCMKTRFKKKRFYVVGRDKTVRKMLTGDIDEALRLLNESPVVAVSETIKIDNSETSGKVVSVVQVNHEDYVVEESDSDKVVEEIFESSGLLPVS